jgi:RND family efflux transporter MFP subunit
MKKIFKYILWGVIIVAAAVGTVYYMLLPKQVKVQKIDRKDLTESFMEQGKYTPKETYILNAQISGEVTDINVTVGQKVKAGDELVVIAPDDVLNEIKQLEYKKNQVAANEESAGIEIAMQIKTLETQLVATESAYQKLFGNNSSASAKIEEAYNNYLFVKKKYEDGLALSKVGALSERELLDLKKNMDDAYNIHQDAQKELSDTNKKYYEDTIQKYKEQIATLKGNSSYKKISKASIDEINTSIDKIKDKLSKNTVKAKFDGVVRAISVEKGQYITEKSQTIVLYDENSMKIKLYLLAEDAMKIKPGHKVQCKLTQGVEFDGEVSFVSPVATQITSSIGLVENRCLVEVTSNNIPAGVGDGFGIDVTFPITLKTNVITAPLSSIVPFEGGSAVYLVKDNKAKLIKVTTGLRASGNVEVLEGIAERDVIITDPIADGVKDKVNVEMVE